jgi:protein-S-isoprenylcysteine O-methyltransferase Ste14
VVDAGPYARVRHPLCLSEIVAMLGAAVTCGGVAPLLGWTLLVALQAYRAVREEEVLLAALPTYAGYRARTARILPGVF